MTIVLAGFALGLIGSGHCALMCGPLVSLMAPARASSSARWMHAVLYHGGRVAVYAAIGALAGALGEVAMLVGLGRALTVAAGLLLIASALGLSFPGWWPSAGARAATAAVATLRRVQAWTIAHELRGPMTSGAINGLLPCGLVYGGVAAAAGLGTIIGGVTFMVAFGLGTAPVLLAIGLSRGAIASALPRRMRRLAPLALAVVGGLLLVRGLTSPVIHTHGDAGAATHTRTPRDAELHLAFALRALVNAVPVSCATHRQAIPP